MGRGGGGRGEPRSGGEDSDGAVEDVEPEPSFQFVPPRAPAELKGQRGEALEERRLRDAAEARERAVSLAAGTRMLDQSSSRFEASLKGVMREKVARSTGESVLELFRAPEFRTEFRGMLREAMMEDEDGPGEGSPCRRTVSVPRAAGRAVPAPSASMRQAGREAGYSSEDGRSSMEASRLQPAHSGPSLKRGLELSPRGAVPKRVAPEKTRANGFGLSSEGVADREERFPFLTPEALADMTALRLTPVQEDMVRWMLVNVYHRWDVSGQPPSRWVRHWMPRPTALWEEARRCFPQGEELFSAELAAERVAVTAFSPLERSGEARLAAPRRVREGAAARPTDDVVEQFRLFYEQQQVGGVPRGTRVVQGDDVQAPALVDPRRTEAVRRQVNDLQKCFNSLTPKLEDSASRRGYSVWVQKVESLAWTQFGPDWEKDQGYVQHMVRAVPVTLSSTLQTLWYDDVRLDPMMEQTISWSEFKEWVQARTARDEEDEAVVARRQLLNRSVKQAGGTLSAYVLKFRRITNVLKDMAEQDLIMHFLGGLSLELAPMCQTDSRGEHWESLDDLVAHARMKEKEWLSREKCAKALGSKEKDGLGIKDRGGRKPWQARLDRKAAKQDGVALNAMTDDPPCGDADAQGGGGRGRGGGRAGGRGRGGRGNGGGRGGAGQGADKSGLVASMVEGDDGKPFSRNREISNAQARYLEKERRCFHCYEPMRECKQSRDGPMCPKAKAETPLAKGAFGGAPAWNGK